MYENVLGAKLALFVGDNLVVIQRDDKPGLLWSGHWDLPGGGREAGESPLQCALRETFEEVSLQIAPSQVTWGRDYGTSSGHISWFFAAWVPPDMADDIELGDEGQGWDLWTPDEFIAHDKAVPQFKHRLQDVLSGVATVAFEVA
jgi:8-oxo-dGTP diphosphatase